MMKRVLRRGRRTWLALTAVVVGGSVIALSSGPAGAKPDSVNGHFTLQTFTGPECESPLDICMRGSVNGKVKGAFFFTPETADPTGEASTVVTTGSATVEAEGSTLRCRHAGAIQLSTDGPFVSLCVITGGTGKWEGASGYMRITGSFTLDDGGEGSYDGKLVLP